MREGAIDKEKRAEVGQGPKSGTINVVYKIEKRRKKRGKFFVIV